MATKRGFQFWTGDVNWLDYGGTWVRKVGARRYHYIQVTNMDDACGRDNEGRPTYVVELSEVDLNAIDAATQASAWQSCDGDNATDETTTTDQRDDITAGACFDYGARAPLHSEEGNNAHAGYRACRAESYTLTRDASAYHERMSRPVNKLGATAREYMTGDMTSAIVRGVDAGNPAARIVAQMYVAAEGQTLGGTIPAADLDAMANAIKR